MTTKHTNLALVEGEVLILTNQGSLSDHLITTNKGVKGLLFSTAKIEGIQQLDGKWFVKPKVDVEELAIETFNLESKEEFSTEDIQSINDFKAGYNAKEAEFTREDMYKMYIFMRTDNYGSFEAYMNEIQSLELPESVTLNENNEVIEVEW